MPEPIYKKILSLDITNIANGEALIQGDYLITREEHLFRVYQIIRKEQ